MDIEIDAFQPDNQKGSNLTREEVMVKDTTNSIPFEEFKMGRTSKEHQRPRRQAMLWEHKIVNGFRA
jgi:hypothetical protein